MEQIPITFEYEGKTYSGNFSPVSGSGDTAVWHLMIDNYYYGQLFYRQNSGWVFYEHFKEMADYFGSYVSAWHDSKMVENTGI